jgi:translation initiation factor 2B subunit (eIF-2B alpha/beta/delta family)/8-oxo-dGTP pyrophosphatase MutT (NUDIX family)
MSDVVTCFLRHRSEILLVRRSDAVGTYPGRWAGVSGYVEGDPSDAERDARREIREETGRTDATLVRAGASVEVRDRGGDGDGSRQWTVHPFLFAVDGREVTPNEEIDAHEWVSPPAIRERGTVPGLWRAYEAVAPTVETVLTDRTHGSTYCSVRALEVLRDHAAVLTDADGVSAVARDLREARPSMAAVANRVNRVMAAGERSPAEVRDRAAAAAESAVDADADAAEHVARHCGEHVATLSRSGTVRTALERARPTVLIGESRPGGEGAEVAASLAESGLDVTLTSDAALPAVLAERDVDAVVVGADAVLADGSVVNKAGTRGLALAAAHEGVPVYVAAAAAKVRPDERSAGESGASAELYDGTAPVSVANPLFDRTPADLVTGVVTERGVLDASDVRSVARDHRRAARWDERE